MCFSAPASFASASVLAVVGWVTMARSIGWRQLPFAAIPFIFALQQFSEGLVWLHLPSTDASISGNLPTYVFLAFAHVVWPVWVPASLLLLARPGIHRISLELCLLMGAAVASYLGFCLIHFGARAEALSHHIHYELLYPLRMIILVGAGYGVATIIPPFISGLRHAWLLGLGTLLSYVITSFFYHLEIASVWCYFSAMLSLTVYVILAGINAARTPPQAVPTGGPSPA